MAVGYENGLICLWDFRQNDLIFPFLGHTNRITHINYFKDRLVSCSIDCTVRSWNVDDLNCDKIYKVGDPCLKFDILSDKNILIVLTLDQTLTFIDLVME